MTKRMLIDATHAEETRVVVLDGNRLEDFDVETSTKRQIKGNIYLARVVRVEPSLQAAFIEYGGNRHGFLAFGEIHPDYYQIPIADRQRLLAMQVQEARDEAARDEAEATLEAPSSAEMFGTESPRSTDSAGSSESGAAPQDEPPAEAHGQPEASPAETDHAADGDAPESPAATAMPAAIIADRFAGEAIASAAEPPPVMLGDHGAADGAEGISGDEPAASDEAPSGEGGLDEVASDAPPPETVGGDGDGADEMRERRIPPRFLRNYKIQEVIHRRQILLVQVIKEERSNKGAALTTYISLAGRFCVLMPNSPRGGGISRKITSAADRRRLKDIVGEFEIPDTMGLIVRTAGANRPKPEIKRDCEYLLRLWDDIRETTMRSVAPALIYEEASLIKRAIRDVYSRDLDEVVVDGEAGFQAAHEFMRMLMPTHARKVIAWRDDGPGGQSLFARYQVEAQLDAMLSPTVPLRSGGYLVINQAEALVAIDVNSGRSTRERNIEDTALRTNMEAAEEVARQLRLRDLAGLIVIDFIDMESKKHNAMVERRLKEALKGDRARIQIGHISHFGLLEMSRQRLRPSLAETSLVTCPHCGGLGHVRSTENAALHVLRSIDEEGAKRRAGEILVHVAGAVAFYILNHKRDRLGEIEQRSGMHVSFAADDSLRPPQMRIERLRAPSAIEAPAAVTPDFTPALPMEAEQEIAEEPMLAEAAPVPAVTAEDTAAGEDAERRRRRRRRRRRGGRREENASESLVEGAGMDDGGVDDARTDNGGEDALRTEGISTAHGDAETEAEAPRAGSAADGAEAPEPAAPPIAAAAPDGAVAAGAEAETSATPRKRTRRGGRRRSGTATEPVTSTADAPPAITYTGPTPANPFGGLAFDIYEAIDQALESELSPPPAAPLPPAAPPVSRRRTAPRPEPAAEPALVPTDAVAEPAAATPMPAEAAAAPAPAEPVPLPASVPEPTPGPAAVDAPTPEPLSVPEQELQIASGAPAAELAEPAIRPIIIGRDPVSAEKKRGWWRR